MKLTKSPLFFYFLFLLGICAVWSTVLQVTPEKTTPWNYGFSIIYGAIFLSGAFLGVTNAIKFGVKSTVGKTLIALGLGLLSWQVGLWIWIYYNIVLNVPVPYPSPADFFFIITFYPLLIFGCFNLLKLYTPKLSTRIKVEAVIVTIVSIIVVCGFLIKLDLPPDLNLYGKINLVGFSLGDSILIAISIMSIRIGGRNIHPSLLILVVGFLIQFAADYMFNARFNSGVYWNGDIADILYTLAGFTVSLGILEVIQSLDAAPTIKPSQ